MCNPLGYYQSFYEYVDKLLLLSQFLAMLSERNQMQLYLFQKIYCSIFRMSSKLEAKSKAILKLLCKKKHGQESKNPSLIYLLVDFF